MRSKVYSCTDGKYNYYVTACSLKDAARLLKTTVYQIKTYGHKFSIGGFYVSNYLQIIVDNPGYIYRGLIGTLKLERMV